MAITDLLKIANTTQDFVPIKEIRSNVVVMKDSSIRSILMVSSVNFGLKSADERTAIITEFQNFLNSIDFPIQIFIQSRRLDIRPYLSILEEAQAKQTNDLLKIQIKEYIEFIRFFTGSHNVMTKNFFVVISYASPIIQTGNTSFLGRVLGRSNKEGTTKIDASGFDEAIEQLNQRTNVIRNGLDRVGLRSEILGTEELIELYYKLFNPGEGSAPTVGADSTSKQ